MAHTWTTGGGAGALWAHLRSVGHVLASAPSCVAAACMHMCPMRSTHTGPSSSAPLMLPACTVNLPRCFRYQGGTKRLVTWRRISWCHVVSRGCMMAGLCVLQLGDIGVAHTCGQLLRASATGCVAPAAAAAAAAGPARVALPTPVAIATFSASAHHLTCAASTASLQPLSYPSSAALSATVRLSDGTSRELPARFANFTLTPASAAGCSLVTSPDGRTSVRVHRGDPCAVSRCGVILTHPTLNATLVATLDISVVDVQRLVPLQLSYDASAADCGAAVRGLSRDVPAPGERDAKTNASRTADVTQLRPLACSLKDYQQATLCIAAEIGAPEPADPPHSPTATHPMHALPAAVVAFVDVTAHATLQLTAEHGSATNGAASLLPNLVDSAIMNRIRPQTPGQYFLTARLGAVESRPAAFQAMPPADAVHVAAIEVDLPPPTPGPCGVLCAATLAGHHGDAAVVGVTLRLDDGSAIALPGAAALAGAQPRVDLFDAPTVLRFNSSAAGVAAASEWGEVALLASAPRKVRLGVSTTCTEGGREIAAWADRWVNLWPRHMDVDLGVEFGPPVSSNVSIAQGVEVRCSSLTHCVLEGLCAWVCVPGTESKRLLPPSYSNPARVCVLRGRPVELLLVVRGPKHSDTSPVVDDAVSLTVLSAS